MAQETQIVEAFIPIEDGQDGSARARFYPNAEAAEEEDQRFNEDTYRDTSTIVNGVLKPASGWGYTLVL